MSLILEIFEIILDSSIEVFLIYIAYKFYKVYLLSRENIHRIVAIVFIIVSAIHAPYLILHHFLGFPFEYSELLHEALLAISIGTLAWVFMPRKSWKNHLQS